MTAASWVSARTDNCSCDIIQSYAMTGPSERTSSYSWLAPFQVLLRTCGALNSPLALIEMNDTIFNWIKPFPSKLNTGIKMTPVQFLPSSS